MKKFIVSLVLTVVFSPLASASCAQIDNAVSYACQLGQRVVKVDIPQQEICSDSYKGTINDIEFRILLGPVSNTQGEIMFFIAGPNKTAQSVGPCIESKADIIE